MKADYQNNPFFWDLLPVDMKEKIKVTALGLLVCPKKQIMRAGANIISHICLVEMPRN